jgi:hypothetical protein
MARPVFETRTRPPKRRPLRIGRDRGWQIFSSNIERFGTRRKVSPETRSYGLTLLINFAGTAGSSQRSGTIQYGGVAVRDRRAGFLLRHVTNPAPCLVGSRSPLAFGCEKTAGSNDLDHDSNFPLIDSHSKRRFRCTAKLCKPCNALDRQFPTKLAITSWPEGCSS